jgi:hypothetical protein
MGCLLTKLPPLEEACKKNDVEAVKKYCQMPNIAELVKEADSFKRTALHHGAHNGSYDVVEELLKVPGINVNVQDKLGYTPLYLAVSGRNNPSGTMEILLKANADPAITSFPDDDGKCTSAMDEALTDELKAYLREHAPKNRA